MDECLCHPGDVLLPNRRQEYIPSLLCTTYLEIAFRVKLLVTTPMIHCTRLGCMRCMYILELECSCAGVKYTIDASLIWRA